MTLSKSTYICLLFILFVRSQPANSQNKNSDKGAGHQVAQQADTQPSSKPNILFLFADDQSTNTIGAYGNTQIKTPNLDRLAREGINFSHAYNMGAWNGAVCQASRAMLNSGLSVWQAHAMDRVYLKGEGIESTWAKLMEQQGYATYMSGKWHVSAKAEEVFQTTGHVRPGMPNDGWVHEEMEKKFADLAAGTSNYRSYLEFMPKGYHRPMSEVDKCWSPTDTQWGGYYDGGKHWSEVLKEDAVAFIDEAKNSDQPFFMYVAFNAPHDPRQAPQQYQDLYNAAELSLPVSWQANYPEKDDIGNGPPLRDAALVPFPRTEFASRVHLKEYYAIVSHLDAQIGEILAALQASGKMNNTYIIYTADHGLAVGEHGLFGKQNMYEHSVRAPFIIWGPDTHGGQTIDADIYLQDAMATSLELAGAEKPEYVFFNSVLSLAKGDATKSAYDAIYGAYIKSQRMIKKDGYKLIVYPRANTIKLFNLSDDPQELKNLANDSSYATKVHSLFESLIALQESMEDTLDLKPMFEAL